MQEGGRGGGREGVWKGRREGEEEGLIEQRDKEGGEVGVGEIEGGKERKGSDDGTQYKSWTMD